MDISTAKKIHCIGIGGIGVSALASLWHAQGKQVSGSDVETGGHRADNVGDVDLVVYSDAVPEDNVERVAARARGIFELSYAQALGQVSREYRTIVVTGTHGKSTTTAMLGLILEAAGFDPLVLVGSKVSEWGNKNIRISRIPSAANDMDEDYANGLRPANDANIRAIRGEAFAPSFFVVEGDDYRDHFLELQPYAVVVTSIEWDHPDYFRDLEHTVESFRKLVEKVPDDGLVVLNQDDTGCQLLHSAIPQNRRMMMYGKGSKMFDQLHLQVPGEFNRYNAAAAATAARALGVPEDVIKRALGAFRGIWRRFEIVGRLDYANGLRPADNANDYIVERELSYKLNGLLFEVQNELGTKFQEKHYSRALEVLLQKHGISYKKEVSFDLQFEGKKIGTLRADFVVEDKILLELKATDRITEEHRLQLLRYLESLNLPLAMVVNFRQRPLNPLRVVNTKGIRAIRGEAFALSQITVISDYAHHPTAIRETMKAAREAYPSRRLVLVYQPHQHSRTKHLFKDFVEVLKDAADVVILSEIYAVKGRMEEREVSSRDIVHEIIKTLKHESKKLFYSGDLQETKRMVLEQIKPGDVLIFMGAGDIDNLARELVN